MDTKEKYGGKKHVYYIYLILQSYKYTYMYSYKWQREWLVRSLFVQ